MATFTATVRVVPPGAGTPTGTVTFTEAASGLTLCAAVRLKTDGTASCVTTALGGGTHVVTAAYSGDDNFNPSSGTLSKTIS